MEVIVYLEDCKEILLEMINEKEYQNVKKQAMEVLIHYGLRYNKGNGKTYDTRGVVCSYCHSSDIPVNPSIEEVIKYQFLGMVKNECFRINYFNKQGKSYFY
jgi:hypothetical protein